jgi:hypothetical protein
LAAAIDGAMASICTTAGERESPPGILNFGWSQGCLAFGLAAIQARAWAIRSSRSLASAVIRPMPSALAGAMSLPSARSAGPAGCPPGAAAHRAAAAGQQAELDLGLAELQPRVVDHDARMAAQRDLQPATQRVAVDRGHHRLALRFQLAQHRFIAIEPSKGSSAVVHFDMRSRSPPAQKSALPR